MEGSCRWEQRGHRHRNHDLQLGLSTRNEARKTTTTTTTTAAAAAASAIKQQQAQNATEIGYRELERTGRPSSHQHRPAATTTTTTTTAAAAAAAAQRTTAASTEAAAAWPRDAGSASGRGQGPTNPRRLLARAQ